MSPIAVALDRLPLAVTNVSPHGLTFVKKSSLGVRLPVQPESG